MIKRIYWTDDIRIDNLFLRKKLFPLKLVPENDITVIVGKNGSGKTRLLSSIEQLCKNQLPAGQSPGVCNCPPVPTA